MNDRIKELAERAFNEANSGDIIDVKIPKEFIEKFTELLVKDCANLVENEGRFTKYDTLANKIRNSFGIK